MSWHYSSELAAEYSVACCAGSEQYARLKSTRIAERSCFDGRKMESCPSSQFGTTSEPSTGAPLLEWWMSSLAAIVSGQLNPTWVDWLMGWPLGWSGLERLEMDRFQEWYAKHGCGLPAEG